MSAELHVLDSDAFATRSEQELVERYKTMLSPEERQRYARYRFEPPRRDFLLGRALVRTVLSNRTGVDPCDFRFEIDIHGRPTVAQPLSAVPLHFNLSHTRGCIACLISAEPASGVDVEYTERRVAALSIAERHFAPVEVQAIRRLPPELLHENFFAVWTLKESYLKARGAGMNVPMDSFWFDLDGPQISVTMAEGADDTPAGWRFTRFQLSPRHIAAISLRSDEPVVIVRYDDIAL